MDGRREGGGGRAVKRLRWHDPLPTAATPTEQFDLLLAGVKVCSLTSITSVRRLMLPKLS